MDATKPAASSSNSSTISVADLIHGSSITSNELGGKNYLLWSAAIRTFLTSKEKQQHIEEDKLVTATSTWAKEDAQNSVKETYGVEGNVQHIYDHCEELFLTKQGSKRLHEHYSSVKAKWEELNLYQPFPTDMLTWKKQRKDLKVVSFLATLGPAYASAKNQILTGSELPTLNATIEDDVVADIEETPAIAANSSSPSLPQEGGGGGGDLLEGVRSWP